MHFNIALLFALTATTQLVSAAPAPAPAPEPAWPAWNSKGPEAGYKVGAVVCGAGAYLCNKFGHTVGQDVLATAGFCCSATAAAVTASQSEGWVAAWEASANAIGNGAKVIGGGLAFGGKWVAHCTVNVCQMIANIATGGGQQPAARTIDAPPAFENDKLVARYSDIDARTPDLIQLGSVHTEDGGSLEFWGKRDVATVEARWGGTKCASGAINPVCDNSHNEAENALCDSLIGNLNGYGSQTIDSSWRQVCYKGQDGKCCTSWSGAIANLKYSDLASNAQTMSTSCSNNGISAKMNGLKLEGVCVNQCLNSGHSCGA